MMQQTNKYKLNLIEKTDTFSPDPLNENMEKVEAQFDNLRAEAAAENAAEAQARAADVAALDQRLQVFEAKHVAVGTYKPTTHLDIDLGFWPVCVIIMMTGSNYGYGMLFRQNTYSYGKITANGFHIASAGTASSIGNGNYTYSYVAFD